MKKNITKAWGNTSLVTGILGVLMFMMPYFGLPLAIVALVGANKQDKIKPTGNSSAGRVLGIIGTIINSIMLLLVIFFLGLGFM